MTGEAENDALNNKTPKKKENCIQNSITCFHISSSILSDKASADLAEIGVKVTNCPQILQAKDICENEVFGMIILEEDDHKDFITDLKVKGSLNEQTPVIYIAQGSLSEDVKSLVKDQYIDDVLFKCSSLDSDLIKAVKRLINEPLQFAVTPKSKIGEASTIKRLKLENKTPVSARRCIANNFPSRDSNSDWSALIMKDSHDAGTFINLDSPTAAQHTVLYESSVNPSMPVFTDQGWMTTQYPQYIPGNGIGKRRKESIKILPELFDRYGDLCSCKQPMQSLQLGALKISETPTASCTSEYHHPTEVPSNKMQILTAAAEMSQALAGIQEQVDPIPCSGHPSDPIPTDHNQSDQFSKLKYYSLKGQGNSESQRPKPQPQVDSTNVNQMQIALQNAEREINSSLPEMLANEVVPKITLSGARQLLDSALLGVRAQTPPKTVQDEQKSEECQGRHTRKSKRDERVTDEEKPKRSHRGRKSVSFNEEKQEWTPNTIEERKELHLSKEKKRRERIATCWHQLRRMIPMCNTKTDKATVFEMTVAYLHHCWMHHADAIQKINKDFSTFYKSGPPEDLDMIDNLVTELLDLENQ